MNQKNLPGQRPALPPGGPQAQATMNLTPRDVWLIIRRHLLLIIIASILGLAIGGTGWYLMRRYYPKYTARTILEVLPPGETDPMTIGQPQAARDVRFGHRALFANQMRQQRTLEDLVMRDRIQQTEWFQSFGDTRDERIRYALRDLDRRLGVSPQRDADLITISMTARSAGESAAIVNELVAMFLARQRATTREDVGQRLSELQEQRNRVQRDLDSATRALDEVSETFGFTDLEQIGNVRSTLQVKLDTLEVQQDELMMQISQLQANVRNLERQAVGPLTEQIKQQIETDPTMIMLTQQLNSQRAQLASRLTRLGENHRVVRQHRELIAETEQRRETRKQEIAEQTRQSNLQRAQDQLVVLQSRYETLERQRSEVAQQKRQHDLARAQYRRRQDIRDAYRERLDTIDESITRRRIVREDPETTKLRFRGNAPVPREISSPRYEIYFPGGLFLGLLTGVGLAFLIELTNDLLRTPREVVRHLPAPLLGVIPHTDEDRQTEGLKSYDVVRKAPFSITSEAYRKLRTNLRLSSFGNGSKTLLVSSPSPGEGKTTIAVNLVSSFAAESKKTLIIDANLRQPKLQEIFSPEGHTPGTVLLGLSDIITGRCEDDQAIYSSAMESVDIIFSGTLPANPAELLSSDRMSELIKNQRQNYDYIVIDGPPILLVSDAKMLATLVDGTVLVFNAEATRRGTAMRAIRELREVNATITGCILHDAKSLKGGYFREQFRSYEQYHSAQPQKPMLKA